MELRRFLFLQLLPSRPEDRHSLTKDLLGVPPHILPSSNLVLLFHFYAICLYEPHSRHPCTCHGFQLSLFYVCEETDLKEQRSCILATNAWENSADPNQTASKKQSD